MAKMGLAVPVGAFQGRARLVSGEEQMGKLVALGMADGDSDNPFNTDAGLTVPLFDVSSGATRALVRRGIEQHFARWQNEERARLDRVNFEVATEGEMAVTVHYTDLEADTVFDVSKTVRMG